MGANESTNENVDKAMGSFNAQEHQQLKDTYTSLCKGGKWLSVCNIQERCGNHFPEHMSKALHIYMKLFESEQLKQNISASFEGFAVCMSHALKGTIEEKAQLLGCLASGNAEKEPSLKQISQVIECFWNSYKDILTSVESHASWKLSTTDDSNVITRALIHDLVSDGKQLQCELLLPSADTTYGLPALHSWLQKSALLLSIMDTVFHTYFPIGFALDSEHQASPQFPVCTQAKWDKFSTILDPAAVVYLNFHLPHELRREWRFLYNSKLHGESFTTMSKRITGQGPSILVIRDTKGHVFGGFATESWKFGSNFVGSPACFLFNLRPHLEVYPSTGYNNHFMYFNHGQETLPNGLGMGGQIGYFGLFLDEEFTRGHSKAEPRCTTYTSPQLSADVDFKLDTLEVWGAGPVAKLTTEEEEEAKAGSILDKDPEAKAMLSLIDKGPHSEGLRQRDPMADTPEEHNLPSGLG